MPEELANSKRQAIALGLAIIAVCLVLYSVWRAMNRPPYVLSITSHESGGMIQLEKPGESPGDSVFSPKIHIPIAVNLDAQVRLQRDTNSIPHGIVEFMDTTTMPGRFLLRFDDVVIDVMPTGIVVNDVSYDWQPRDSAAPVVTPGVPEPPVEP